MTRHALEDSSLCQSALWSARPFLWLTSFYKVLTLTVITDTFAKAKLTPLNRSQFNDACESVDSGLRAHRQYRFLSCTAERLHGGRYSAVTSP